MKTITASLAGGLLLLLGACSDDAHFAGGSGLIETNETVVSAETAGRVIQRLFDEGTAVAAGDTLVVIDPSHLQLELQSAAAGREVIRAQLNTAQLQVGQARAAEELARTEFERAERLLQSGTTTQRQFDRAEFEYTQARIACQTAEAQVKTLEAEVIRAEASIARLQRQFIDCYPVSTIGGIVIEKFVQPGELLAPGKPIAKIANLDTVWVKVYLAAGSFANVKLGTRATVSTESGGREFPGTVVWTSEEAEFTPKNVQTEQSRADLVYAVKISIPNEDGTLKVGMPVFVELARP